MSSDPFREAEFPVSDILPLKRHWFHILLALADGPKHGYAIRADVEERTEGRVKLRAATLYGSVREMAEKGLIEEAEGAGEPDGDQRRRDYRLVPEGSRILHSEADRLEALVEAVRRSGTAGRA